MTDNNIRALLDKALEQLRCNTDNMQKGMSKSVQKLCAKENREVLEEIRAAMPKREKPAELKTKDFPAVIEAKNVVIRQAEFYQSMMMDDDSIDKAKGSAA